MGMDYYALNNRETLVRQFYHRSVFMSR